MRRVVASLVGLLALAACQPAVPSLPIAAPGLPPLAAPASTPQAPQGEFRIALKSADGAGARWNPCEPIRIVMNLQDAPAFAVSELNAAIAQIEEASGLDLVYQGTTTQRPTTHTFTNKALYGDVWSPVLISFASASEVPFDSPVASAFGKARPVTNSLGRYQYVTGQVILRPGAGWTAGVSSANPLRLMLQHEIGHVLGLAHVASKQEIMGTGGNGSVRSWGPGDVRGLRALGRQAGCLPPLV